MWPLAAAFLTRAAIRGGEFIDGWIDLLANQKAQLWIAWNGEDCEAAAITQLVERKNGRACQMIACGGRDMRNWLGVLDEIEAWAKTQGCRQFRIPQARKGWARILPDYDVTGFVMSKDI